MAAKKLSSLGVLFTDRRDFYIRPNIVRELWTDVAPFTTIVSNRGIETTTDPDFKLFEHRSSWIRQEFQVNDTPEAWASNGVPGDILANSDTLAINNIVGLAATPDASYKNLLCEVYASDRTTYKGIILITGVASAKLAFKSMGNPRAANSRVSALADDDIFVVIGNAHGEGTEAPEAWADELEVVYNSTQIFKTPVEVTGTLYHAALRGYSKELERLRMEKSKEHKMQKERDFLLGTRIGGTGMTDLAANNVTHADLHEGADDLAHTTDADGKKVRTTMGLINAIYRYGTETGDSQNIFTIDATSYAYSNFVDDMEKVFQYIPESGSKVALCGRGAMSYWSKVDASNGFVQKSGFSVQLASTERSSLGFNFRTLETPHGNLTLVPAPVLRGPYNNTMLIVEAEDLRYVQYRPQIYQTNIKTDNAYDGVKDQYFSDEGIGITLIEKHSIWNIINN